MICNDYVFDKSRACAIQLLFLGMFMHSLLLAHIIADGPATAFAYISIAGRMDGIDVGSREGRQRLRAAFYRCRGGQGGHGQRVIHRLRLFACFIVMFVCVYCRSNRWCSEDCSDYFLL